MVGLEHKKLYHLSIGVHGRNSLLNGVPTQLYKFPTHLVHGSIKKFNPGHGDTAKLNPDYTKKKVFFEEPTKNRTPVEVDSPLLPFKEQTILIHHVHPLLF